MNKDLESKHQRQRSHSDTESNIHQNVSTRLIDNRNRRKSGRRKSIKKSSQRKKKLKSIDQNVKKSSDENLSPLIQQKMSFSKGHSYDHITSRLFQPTTSFLQHVYRGRELQHNISLSSESSLFKVQHTTHSLTGEISKTTEPFIKDIDDESLNIHHHHHHHHQYPLTHSSGGNRGRKACRQPRSFDQSRSLSRESMSSYNSISTDYLSDSSCLWTDSETASVASLPIVLPTHLQQSQDALTEKMRPLIIQKLLRYSSSSTPQNSDSENSVDLKLT